MHAIDLANALAEFEPYWFEEPCQSENVEALAEVRHASRIPVVTGEALLTRAGFRPVIRTRAVDIINPDVSNCGGTLELMYIAAAAESEAIAVSPHNYNSTTMALSATVHASACMPNRAGVILGSPPSVKLSQTARWKRDIMPPLHE
jgi:galactonate dehydratase